ncbi:MAG: potassium transporter TrkG, partial [Thermoguttaceae bacterium]
VPADIFGRLTGLRRNVTLTTKVILGSSFVIFLTGTGGYFFCQMFSCGSRNWLASMFQIGSASTTAGFSTVPIGELAPATLVLIIFVMIIGASPSGTGGGIKTTSVTVLIAIVLSVMRGHPERISFFRQAIPMSRIFTAVAVVSTYILLLFFTVFLLCMTENLDFLPICFESVSALGTVGLSMGITSELSTYGKMIITVTMFFGRIGPLTLGLAILYNTGKQRTQVPSLADIAT